MNDIGRNIHERLKGGPEQTKVVGPLVGYLIGQGWSHGQIIFGKKEWQVPKTPSDQQRRERNRKFQGFPVDIAVFDHEENVGDPRHLLFIIECKRPEETSGISQLEAYFVGEPHVQLGIWANDADPSAPSVYIYRRSDGRLLLKRGRINDLPKPGEAIRPETRRTCYEDLIQPTEQIFRSTIKDLLDKIVMVDTVVTRREEQLDQLCNLLLLKLESDKQAKANLAEPVFFRPMESDKRTGDAIRERYGNFVYLYPDTFTSPQDQALRFTDKTLAACVETLSSLCLIELGVSTVSVAFQILRSEALKQGEGQYFTPQAVIEAGVRLMQIKWDDIVIDPACGTGGFLIETMLEIRRTYHHMDSEGLSRWAQTHVFGIEKDPIGVKLTKAIMQIAGDGSAHCVRGDSVRVHHWGTDFPHLADGRFRDGRYTVVVTNPPFGQNLKVNASDLRLSGLDIGSREDGIYRDIEIGLVFLQRAWQLLRVGGRVGIVLPETYFFSANYAFLFDWIRPRLRPLAVVNIPMEAFQGFCRAKTNFYVFQKIEEEIPGEQQIAFLNPQTCGIYKNGGVRFKTDPESGRRTDEIDNELADAVAAYLGGQVPPAQTFVSSARVFEQKVLVPTYYDMRHNAGIHRIASDHGIGIVSIGQLLDHGTIMVREGHGSPSNDQRRGNIPYVKVSDIRALRVNVNPTNLVTRGVAERYWKSDRSGLAAWDVITPNRASSNIGEFAILLPGEEHIVITREIFAFRVVEDAGAWDPFYLLWCLCLNAVRDQWRRVALMQTNREDCGFRYREIMLPDPPNLEWARKRSGAFRRYFTALSESRRRFVQDLKEDGFDYIASAGTNHGAPSPAD